MTSAEKALAIFKKWHSEGALISLREHFSGSFLDALCRISEVSEEQVEFGGIDGNFNFALRFLPEMQFEYAKLKDLPSDGRLTRKEKDEFGLSVFVLPQRIGFLFVAKSSISRVRKTF